MDWGYWGIFAGLMLLVGTFFAGMEILYSRARNRGGTVTPHTTEPSAGSEKSDRHAA